MKILLYISELTYSGSPNSTLRLARALYDSNNYVETWSYSDGVFRKEYENHNIPVKVVKKNELRDKKTIQNVKKFDLFIANSILTYEAFEGIRTLIPSYWYIREAENIPYFFRAASFKCGHMLQKCNNIITVSEYAADYIKKYFNSDVRILHNCVDDVYLQFDKKSESCEGRIKLIMIGTIERRKNFALLIDAFNSLPIEYREKIELHFVGRVLDFEKEYADYVISKIDSNENIYYYGEITDRNELMDIISKMHVLAVISSDESCSLTALEGAMMAKPLLLSENIGAKYLVDSSNGWIVKTDNCEALRDAIIDVIDNKARLLAMGIVSRKRYEETSTFEIYRSNVNKLIKSVKENKLFYRIRHLKNNRIWYFDDTTKYFKFPEWGETDESRHLYSFDIFDTVITRDLASPIGIFALIQKKLYEEEQYMGISEYSKKNFVELRTGSEGFARQIYCVNGIEDKTLDQIYRAMESCGRFSSSELIKLKELEIALEYDHVIGIQEIIDEIKILKADKKRVVMISDMYLSSNIIRKMLLKVDDVFSDIPIYVSSECRLMKGTKNLFKYVQEKEKVDFSNWTHTGDNINADINAPSELGIKCKHYTKMNLSKAEAEILRINERDYFVQQTFGFTKIAAAQGIVKDTDKSFIIDIYNLLLPFVNESIVYLKENKCDVAYCANDFGRLLKTLFAIYYKVKGIKLIYIPCLTSVPQILEGNFLNAANRLRYLLCNNKMRLEDLCGDLQISRLDIDMIVSTIKADLIESDDNNLAYGIFSNPNFMKLLKTKIEELFKSTKATYIDYSYNPIYMSCISKSIKEIKLSTLYYTKDSRFKDGEYSGRNKSFMSLSKEENKFFLKLIERSASEISAHGVKNPLYNDINPAFFENFNETGNRISLHNFVRNYYNNIKGKYKEESKFRPEEKYDVVSFCLQECILTYSVAKKEGIFQLIKQHISSKDCPLEYSKNFLSEFIDIRKEAETLVVSRYREKKIEKKNLKSVYDVIYNLSNLSRAEINYILRYEYRLIKESLFGVQENICRIEKAVNNHQNVVLVGDTMYSQKFIRKILNDINPIFENIPLYATSSAPIHYYNSTDFFESILKEMSIAKSKWYHVGSSIQFDINGSNAMGIRKEQYKGADLQKYEKAALFEFGEKLPVQLMIGTARNNRLLYKGSSAQVIGNSFAGPMLYPYVQWILDDTIRRGIHKLLFIARDGYVLKQIADIIIKNQSLDISTEYVYGSRKAWRMASYIEEDNLDIFFRMAHINQLVDVESFLKIFNISCEELICFLPKEFKNINYHLQKTDYEKIREHLENDIKFKHFVAKKAHIEREKVALYFKNILKDEICSFVELSGTGTTQNCLGKILEDITNNTIITYFLNLDGIVQVKNMKFLNYIPNNFWYSWIIENLCRAPHGQTDGYKTVGELVEPVFAGRGEELALIAHGYLDYVYGVMQFSQNYSKIHYLDQEDRQSPVLFVKYLKHMTYNPSEEIKEFIGDMPFEATGFGKKISVYAPKLTQEQMKQIFLTRSENESLDKYYDGADIDFTLKRMSQEDINKINFYKASVGTKYGRNARIKKKLLQNGYIDTMKFLYKRVCREIMIKMKLIKY